MSIVKMYYSRFMSAKKAYWQNKTDENFKALLAAWHNYQAVK